MGHDMTTPEMLAARTDYARGFDAGNYGNAYESHDWASWSARHNFGEQRSKAYLDGLLLGFFSTYELHEIPRSLRMQVAALRGSEHAE